MGHPAFFKYLPMLLGVTTIAAGQVGAKLTSTLTIPEFRRLGPGAAVCVNTPLNTAGGEMEIEKAGEELAQRIRAVGFVSGTLGTLSHCDALVFTEITARSRNTVELDFRIVLSDEQAPGCAHRRAARVAMESPGVPRPTAPSPMRRRKF